jgi:ABC-type antimicrobial peptide transport system permease subunit
MPGLPKPHFSIPLEFSLAWRSLQVHRLRTFLSALAVGLGTGIIISTSVVESGMRGAWATGQSKLDFLPALMDVIFNGVGIMLLIVAGFMIFNAFAMAITQQRQQIGMLRSLGMTRRQVLQQVLIEALFTGGLGTALGLGLGPLLGRAILAVIQWFGLELGRGSVAPAGVALALFMGLGITLLSALVPARQAASVAPLAALRGNEVLGPGQAAGQKPSFFPKTRFLIGFGLLAAMWAYLAIAPPGEWTGSHPPWDWGMMLGLWCAWLLGLWLALPALVGGLVDGLRVALCRAAVGRLLGDNLARAPGRVTLTALTFALGLMAMVGTAGIVSFGNDVLVARLAKNVLGSVGWTIYPFNRVDGLAQMSAFDTGASGVEPGIVDEVRHVALGRATVNEFYTLAVPEISSPMPGMPSMLVMDVERVQQLDAYNLIEGDWPSALSILKGTCGVLTTPAIAAKHHVKVGGTITVTGRAGRLPCIVAGLGSGGVVPLSILGPGARAGFVDSRHSPDGLMINPLPGVDAAALEADLYALHARYGDKAFVSRPKDEIEGITSTSDQLMHIFNGLMLLAVVAAALGMVNTTVMSVAERRRELGVLRAVGATRRQVILVVVGEAALTALIGALLGALAGVGIGVIFGLAYGGVTFGLLDLPLWSAAGVVASHALLNGLAGILAAPPLAALAAYPAVRTVVGGSAIETLEARQLALSTSKAQGKLQSRLALGTAGVMIAVSVGVIAVVTGHSRRYFEETTFDAARRMATLNAGLIELALPQRVHNLDWNTLRAGGAFGDDQTLAQFKTFKQDMQENGVLDFTVADSDNFVLVNLDVEAIGQRAAAFETLEQANAFSEDRRGRLFVQAVAPIRNRDELVVGSVRMTLDARRIQDLQAQLWGFLGGTGLAMTIAAVLLSLALGRPLLTRVGAGSRACPKDNRLSADRQVGVPHAPQLPLGSSVKVWFPAQMRLALMLAVMMAATVGVLARVAIPIERYYTQDMLQDNWTLGAEWIAHALSNSSDLSLPSLLRGWQPEPCELMSVSPSLDLERLQALADDVRGKDMAYVALVNGKGEIVLSDQLALVDETAPLPNDTHIEEATWHGEDVWVISTPLRQGDGGKQLGVLQIAVRREGLDDWIGDSRYLFLLGGLVAALAGVLLAQLIGGTGATPS